MAINTTTDWLAAKLANTPKEPADTYVNAVREFLNTLAGENGWLAVEPYTRYAQYQIAFMRPDQDTNSQAVASIHFPMPRYGSNAPLPDCIVEMMYNGTECRYQINHETNRIRFNRKGFLSRLEQVYSSAVSDDRWQARLKEAKRLDEEFRQEHADLIGRLEALPCTEGKVACNQMKGTIGITLNLTAVQWHQLEQLLGPCGSD